MTWGFVAHRGSANNKTSGSILSVLPTAQLNAGAILVAVAVSDNIEIANVHSNTHIVVDFLNNGWHKIVEGTNIAAANAGITASVWITRVRKAISTTDPIIFGLRSAVTAKAIGLYEYSLTAGNSFRVVNSIVEQQDNVTSPSATLSGLVSSPYALFGVVARENDNINTYIQDVDYNDRTKFGTTGGTGNTNVSCIVGDRLATLTGDTFAPTVLQAASDTLTILIALEEIVQPSMSLTFNDCTQLELRDLLRATYKNSNSSQLCKLANWIIQQNFSDATLQSIFGVSAAQLPSLKTRLDNQAGLYNSLFSQIGQ